MALKANVSFCGLSARHLGNERRHVSSGLQTCACLIIRQTEHSRRHMHLSGDAKCQVRAPWKELSSVTVEGRRSRSPQVTCEEGGTCVRVIDIIFLWQEAIYLWENRITLD